MFGGRRPGERDPRRDIFVIGLPKWRLPVCLPAQLKSDQRTICLTLIHGERPVLEEVVHADRGADLRPRGFIWGLQQRVAYSQSKGEVRLNSPDILRIPLRLVAAEATMNGF